MNIDEVGQSAFLVNGQKRDPVTWQAAQSLEASFVSEMLKSAGLGKSRESLGGGAGEDQFSSFLTQEYAKATVKAGGIGLAEAIYQSTINKEGSK